jgi:uncharacterized membrane protein YvlD (DUF360 family)
VGKKLPAAFMGTLEEQGSPYYSFNTGVAIALGTMFVLGILATRAEPALNVLGQTVEKLTKGSFTKNMLIYAVCFGVGTGMTVGATKILFGAGASSAVYMMTCTCVVYTPRCAVSYVHIQPAVPYHACSVIRSTAYTWGLYYVQHVRQSGGRCGGPWPSVTRYACMHSAPRASITLPPAHAR